MSGTQRSRRGDLIISAALSSSSLKSKIIQIHSKISVKGKRGDPREMRDHSMSCSPCSPGSSRTVRRILGACVVSFLTLLGSVSLDLRDCVLEWRNTKAARDAFTSCSTLLAMRSIQFLQDQRRFCCGAMRTSSERRAQLLHKVRSFCRETHELHNHETCEDARQNCTLLIHRVLVRLEGMADGDLGQVLSMVINEILDEINNPIDNRNIVKENPYWTDVLCLHLLIRATEDIRYMLSAVPVSSNPLLYYQSITSLHYAVYTSDTLYDCWKENKNLSLYEDIHSFASNASMLDPALADSLVSMQECLYWEGYRKLSNKSKETLSTLSLKVTLLTVSCLIYPIVLVSFKQMTEWIQNYARSLKERTEDLKKERRLAEDLLHQMLPKTVAKQLRKHKHVEAESYEQVTIFFSDVVGFTSISASCTPLQVVEMLNNLYVCFDSRIESYNVYKVETIGDAYMVVSGLPERSNGKHADEIAKMSLDLVAAVRQVIIPHMPSERLRLRAGIHTGPCVAGVVGYKMPRYCLFGDTVNTASRMESTSLPQKIHISSATYQVLLIDNAYEIQPRGEIEVKGKGQMKTYWLLGNKNYSVQNDSLVCHWNPDPSRRKMKSNMGSGHQSLSSNILSDTSQVTTPCTPQDVTGEETSGNPEQRDTTPQVYQLRPDPVPALVIPVPTTQRRVLEKAVLLPGCVESM